jgi:hypothetical protein
MESRAEKEFAKKPPLLFLQGLHDIDTENAFAKDARKAGE